MADTRRPEGVIEKKGRWYWRPTSERERLERARKGLPETVPLGAAGSDAARKKWAEVTGRRESTAAAGTVSELLGAWARLDEKGRPAEGAPIWTKDNGKPRSSGTVKQYAWAIRKVLMPRFGAMRYGKTAIEAASGRAIGTVDVQRLVADIGTTSANVYVACLSSVFMWAKRNGRTTYNPCEDVAKIAQEGRTRAARAWEVECLGAMAEATGRDRLALQIDFESISGWRACDILSLTRKQLTPEGIRSVAQKNGKRVLLQWNEDLKRIVREALELPGAQRAGVFPLSPVFASRRGGKVSGPAFWDAFRTLVERTNEILAAGVVDPATLERHAALAIEDLGFHDLRSKAGDDAAEAGQDIHEFLGNTPAVAAKHYARRERKIVPLSLKR
jgi:hypothetical protein